MAFCKQCGNKLEEGQKFCKNCGFHSNSSQKQENLNSVTSEKKYTKKTYKMKNGTKIGLCVAAIIAICLYIGYYFVAQTLTPHAISQGFISAIKEKDVSKLKSFINDGQVQLEATDEDVEAYLAYIEENPDYLNETIEQLELLTAMHENGEMISVVEDYEGLVHLKKSGNKWLLFDRYVIEISPVFIVVTTDTDETIVHINGEKLGTVNEDDEKKYGPYLPGEYTVKMTVDGGYGAVEINEKVSSSSDVETNLYVHADFSNHYISLYTNDGDAILFVNGKSTKKTIDEIDEFGPIKLDGTVEVFAERVADGGKERTQVVVVEQGTYSVDLYFEEAEEMIVEQEIHDTLDDVGDIEETIYNHYDRISNGNFAGAYALFSSSKRSAMTESGWSNGLQSTILDEVTYIKVSEINGDTATAYIHMTSYDEQEDGTTLVQDWKGTWSLVKESGSWYLDKAKLEKTGSEVQ